MKLDEENVYVAKHNLDAHQLEREARALVQFRQIKNRMELLALRDELKTLSINRRVCERACTLVDEELKKRNK